MIERGPADGASNPFSTRRTRPGALEYLFAGGQTLAGVARQLAAQDWWGEIVGPHGSGKSTLLSALLPLVEKERQPLLLALHDGQRALPIDLEAIEGPDEPRLIVVDGYEQLSRWNRHRLKRLCRRRGWGLLVTAHQGVGLPPLVETAADLVRAEQIVARLLAERACAISAADVRRTFERSGGNVREMLFELYDLYERGESSRPRATDGGAPEGSADR